MMFHSIRLRLTLSYLLVIVLAMGLLGFLLLSFVQRYFLRAMEESLIAQARITAQTLIPGVVTPGPPIDSQGPAANAVQQQMTSNIGVQTENFRLLPAGPIEPDLAYLSDVSVQLSTQLDTRIRILDSLGIVLVDSQQEQRGTSLLDDPLVEKALSGKYGSRSDWTRGQTPAMHLAMPALLEGKLAAVIYLSQPLRDVVAVLHDLRTRWLWSTGIALALSAAVGLVLSRAIARPVRRLTTAAGAVAGGRLDQQVPVTSRDELGRLSETFNEMTGRLRAARQMQTDFVANVSHELRTPLTGLKGMIETLREGAVDDPGVRDRFLATAEGETDRLIRLVNDLLLLSRADSEALPLQRAAVDLAQLARSAVEQMAPRAGAHGITLQVEALPGTPAAWADRDRVEQVLVNLLDNACKFSRQGETVTVRVEGAAGRPVQVSVRDQGIGIPAEHLARVGERFYRADRARSRAEGGSGLGLSIAQALVELHGGWLRVESQEGVGTEVTFTLPSVP